MKEFLIHHDVNYPIDHSSPTFEVVFRAPTLWAEALERYRLSDCINSVEALIWARDNAHGRKYTVYYVAFQGIELPAYLRYIYGNKPPTYTI